MKTKELDKIAKELQYKYCGWNKHYTWLGNFGAVSVRYCKPCERERSRANYQKRKRKD